MSRYKNLKTTCSMAVLSFALAACGGGSGSGSFTSSTDSLRGQLAAAQAAQTAAETAQATAETARMDAETARTAAETAQAAAEAAQMMAETDRDAANTASAAAAQAQMDAETAQATAEAAQATAEAAQATAEAAQATAEAAQTAAEGERDAATAAAVVSEQARMDAETARAAAETARAAAETARAAAAAAQATAEAAQGTAEDERDLANQRAVDAVAAAEAAEMRATTAEMAQAAAELAQMGAETAQATAEQAQTAAEMAQTMAEGQRDAAIENVATAEGERDEANRLLGLALAAQAMAEGERDMYKTRADKAEADLATALAALKVATDDLAALQETVDEQAMKRAQAERLARGNAISKAISANLVGESAEDARESIEDDGKGNRKRVKLNSQLPFVYTTDVRATRSSAGRVTVKVTVASDDTKFTGGGANAGTAWTGAELTRNTGEGNTAAEETAMVYTDIGAPTSWPIASEFVRDTTYVEINDQARSAYVKPTSAPVAGASESFNYPNNAKFAGTYRGVPGTFTCGVTTGCSVSTAADGTVTVKGAGNNVDFKATFVPTNVAATYDRQDSSYVYFGWWLNKPTGATAEYKVESFAGTGGSDIARGTKDMVGKATYKGPAIGKYVVKSSTAGVTTDAEAGHFTAAATLTADFLPTADTSNDVGTISGKVDRFVTSGDADGSAWRVNLKSVKLSDKSNVFTQSTSVTFGGLTVDDAGYWRGSFYDEVTDTGAAAPPAPGTVIGTFDAHDPGGTANISGAYGAKRQTGN